ncbi:MAG TPA: sensor domain-containing diguanylate cyclase [Gemmatimonadaceae bacterium]|nr:sensor domain-containing diguanylate cyclase [Gemmatimonadaceae bacterium]
MPTRFRSLSDPDSLREFAKNLREGIYITTRNGRILDANRAFLEMFGVCSIDELGENGALDLWVDPARRNEQMRLLETEGHVREFEIELRRPDGERRIVLDTCYLIRDPDTGEAFIHGILVDITARKQLEARLVEMSTHDALTGALNRHFLMQVEEQFARDPEQRCGCIFVDIDHFKVYNDRYGHHEGDEVLKRMARFLMRYVRAEEAVLRVGGDEFVVMLVNADAVATRLVADRLRTEALEHAPVPFSLGWAARDPGETLPHLLDRADQGLLEVRVMKRSTDPRQHPTLPDRD